MTQEPRFTAIVLAAQRDGRLDPLAAEAGVSHKCLVPIGGRPLLAHVLEALAAHGGVESIRISVEEGAADRLRVVDGASGELGVPVAFIPSAASITDSVYAAAQGAEGPFIVTTADNVLLTPAAVRRVADRLAAGDDAVLALSRKEDVLSAHPQGQRRFYRFTDGSYSNCNLYGLSRRGLSMAETFRTGGQFAKNPMRIAAAFGLLNLILLRYGLISLDRAMARVGRRFGARASAVVLEDGAHAIDVDNPRTYAIAALLLERRASLS
ncbi:NTP transferase domain-containing protein [Sphingosinicella sp. CPCC 101087]|uniref:NTP transferase domain-containing protein n=1 Tax=Sphingosinicella sp. CPCC 101087 TaxID=2497754 RepID=UPI00101C2DBC|nr:NTP transferase domain-containing protein [Sphingosinicella sp. CPCC 101087]